MIRDCVLQFIYIGPFAASIQLDVFQTPHFISLSGEKHLTVPACSSAGSSPTPYDASANQSQQLHTTTNSVLLRRLTALLSSPLTSASGTSDGDDLSVSFSLSAPPGSGSPDEDEGVSELLSVGIVGTEKEWWLVSDRGVKSDHIISV